MKLWIVFLLIGAGVTGFLAFQGLRAAPVEFARLAFLAFSALLVASVLALVLGRDQTHRMP
jgi:hypothetical protein